MMTIEKLTGIVTGVAGVCKQALTRVITLESMVSELEQKLNIFVETESKRPKPPKKVNDEPEAIAIALHLRYVLGYSYDQIGASNVITRGKASAACTWTNVQMAAFFAENPKAKELYEQGLEHPEFKTYAPTFIRRADQETKEKDDE